MWQASPSINSRVIPFAFSYNRPLLINAFPRPTLFGLLVLVTKQELFMNLGFLVGTMLCLELLDQGTSPASLLLPGQRSDVRLSAVQCYAVHCTAVHSIVFACSVF